MSRGELSTAQRGRKGERLASRYLRWRGYRVVERNFRCPLGEIDLIVQKRGTVVFCEVKTRTGDGFAPPYEAVNRGKMMRLERTAEYWLNTRPQPDRQCRFDVITVLLGKGKPRLEHMEDAFRPAEVD